MNSKDYPPSIIEGWSIRSTAKKFRKFYDQSIRFVAIENGTILGFGEIIKETGNLGAMYVHKNWIGKGIGKKLFILLEKEAVKMGVKKWKFNSSITAKKFYEACGCKIVRKIKHRLRNGTQMNAYEMEKILW